MDDRTPYLGKFTFNRITAINSEWAAGYFYGLPEMPIEEIVIKDSTFTMKDNASSGEPAMMSFIKPVSKIGFYFNNVNKVIFDNVTLSNQDGEKVIQENVGNIEIK